jgi:hypothetical protein
MGNSQGAVSRLLCPVSMGDEEIGAAFADHDG